MKKGENSKLFIWFKILVVFVAAISSLFLFPSSSLMADFTNLFEDNFDQNGSGLTNGWDNFSGASSPSRTTDLWVRIGSDGRGLRLNGDNSSNPDDGVQRKIATKGYSSLKIKYSRAISGFESGDEFVSQYSLDDGEFITLETPTSDQEHETVSFDVSNPNRNTKLTLRFFVNANEDNDRVAVENVVLSGENAPLFYDGFESGGFVDGEWILSGDTDVIHSSIISGNKIWTDDNDTDSGHDTSSSHKTNAHGTQLKGDSDLNPGKGQISKAFDTTGYENIYLRYARRVNDLESGDNFNSYYSSDNGSTWITLETLNDNNDSEDFASVVFGPLSDADNNSNFKIKFWLNGNSSNDEVFIDDVVIWGDVIPPQEEESEESEDNQEQNQDENNDENENQNEENNQESENNGNNEQGSEENVDSPQENEADINNEENASNNAETDENQNQQEDGGVVNSLLHGNGAPGASGFIGDFFFSNNNEAQVLGEETTREEEIARLKDLIESLKLQLVEAMKIQIEFLRQQLIDIITKEIYKLELLISELQ